MACACKVNKKIEYLRRKYGDNIPQSKKTDIVGSISLKLKSIGIFLLSIPFIPFMIFSITKTHISKKPLKLEKFFKLA